MYPSFTQFQEIAKNPKLLEEDNERVAQNRRKIKKLLVNGIVTFIIVTNVYSVTPSVKSITFNSKGQIGHMRRLEEQDDFVLLCANSESNPNSSNSCFAEAFSVQPNLHRPKPDITSLSSKKLESEEEKNQTFDYLKTMSELDNQRLEKKKVVTINLNSKTYTREGTKHLDKLEGRLANQLYESTRQEEQDSYNIAAQSKLPINKVEQVKNHVFIKEHVLDKYVHLGEDPEVKRFDPNLKQALVWERLKIGEGSENDFEWFSHELEESTYEIENNSTYSEAHNFAEQKFRGNPWNEAYIQKD